MVHYGFGGQRAPEGVDPNSLPRVALPADFVALREASRGRQRTESTSSASAMPDLEDVSSETAPDGSEAATESSVRSDGLLVDNETIDQLLDSIVASVQESLSSEFVGEASAKVVEQKSDSRNRYLKKRDDEIAGLRAAVSNAVEKGSCSVEKLSIVDHAVQEPRPEPESPPDAPRDPRDRRKRMRSSCYRYVIQAEVPNSIRSLINELKLTFKDPSIGLGLGEVFSALEGHLDKPLEDTWTGVSINY